MQARPTRYEGFEGITLAADVWGSEDDIVPSSYATRFAQGLQRAHTEIRLVEGAGHRVDVDAPEELAEAILQFLAA